ncbi:hypothetical protein TanjilG_12653 [Lupinus angustifolius]|uniref:Uncharacterized protein n=1 Tax=Lupinus angustifolius TaxID=3871 RepID=A0A4P1QZ27_LUPAN|nr:PREDICTED: uncharacterized protein LOC109327196 [Lupinus angustifolius]OIV97896.1 hypothetical protein TanjilG_12653 [Lupinus angustifolius]
MIKGRETKAAPSTDLLVCFPSRAHLSLMPKPICSPARPSESKKLGHGRHHKRTFSKGGGSDQASSPLLWGKSTKSMGSEIAEPTSPKVTCAGQIKVRPKTNAGYRNWQSVMGEIEKIHNDKKQKKRGVNWVETFGFKKEVMQFLTCLRSIRFDLRCFGSFPGTDIAAEDDEEEDDVEDEEGYHENHVKVEESHDNEDSEARFSKWFMVLQENENNELKEKDKVIRDDGAMAKNYVPPPNALLLMRCRSAPAKSWLNDESEGGYIHEERVKEKYERKGKGKEKEKEKEELKVIQKGKSLKSLMDEEKRNKDNLYVMRYATDFYELSSDIAKETWIVGDLRDSFSRSRSWKR